MNPDGLSPMGNGLNLKKLSVSKHLRGPKVTDWAQTQICRKPQIQPLSNKLEGADVPRKPCRFSQKTKNIAENRRRPWIPTRHLRSVILSAALFQKNRALVLPEKHFRTNGRRIAVQTGGVLQYKCEMYCGVFPSSRPRSQEGTAIQMGGILPCKMEVYCTRF